MTSHYQKLLSSSLSRKIVDDNISSIKDDNNDNESSIDTMLSGKLSESESSNESESSSSSSENENEDKRRKKKLLKMKITRK